MTEYCYTTSDLADEFSISAKTVRKKAAKLGIGIDFDGRAGFRYSEADRAALIESLRPSPTSTPTKQRRKRRAA